MSKHTPGPWFLGLSADNKIHCVDAIDPVDGRKFEVCEVWGIDDDKTETDVSHANARLIAAAPDLLDALEDALSDYDAWMKDADVTPNESLLAWTNKARAAIARARGEA